ncbi:DMT family transporter [Streptomyces sp. NPDC059063]|uniref:DMT family transporter n=1 Tax=unclassified Streptomyces TaxID=2593676 RepID=UPI0036A1E9E0
MSGTSRNTGVLYGVAAMTVVGSSAAVLAGIADYPTFGGQALRYAGATLVLLVILWLRRVHHLRLTGREFGRLTLLAGTGLAGFNVCYVEAVRHGDPASVGAIIGGVPIVLAVLDPLLRHRAPSVRLVAAALVVSGGVALTQGFGGGSVVSLLWAVGALAGEVAFSLLAVPVLPRLGPMRVSAYAAALSVPLLLVAAAIADGGGALPRPTAKEAVALAYLAVVVTALAFVMWYAAVSSLGADRAGLCAGLAPASAVLAAWLLGTGSPNAADVAGALLVGCGVILGLAPARRTPPDGSIRTPDPGSTRPSATY